MKPTNEEIVSLKNVTMAYSGNNVLKGINLDIYPGQIIGYIGPNGAGKSTTLKIMLGLIEGYEGKVEIFGQNISQDKVTYKKKIGYVPENADIYDNLTAYEYLTFIGELYGMKREIAGEKAKKVMKVFEMDDVIHSRISSYSKGMRQKVIIASSLLHNPDLIFLDEPLSGLDANSVMIIKDILEQLANNGKTILYSSHIMDVVEKISHRIVLLVDGTIAADGSFEELKNSNKEGSLEGIFNQITGSDDYKQTADQLVKIIMGEPVDE